MPKPSPALYRRIFAGFDAPVSRFDCGKHCAPLNGGAPVCCSTDHAVPILDRHEFRLLRSRSDLWRRFEASDADGREVVRDMHPDCLAAECKGAQFCERENRSLSCRAFPFFPYLTRADDFVGLACFWGFEDRCWVQSNLHIVDRRYVRQFVKAYELLFAFDPEERQANREESAAARAVFTRRNKIMKLIGRDGEFLAVEPRTHEIRKARRHEYQWHENFSGTARAQAAPR